MTDVLLYDVLGNNWRWGQDDHGVYAVAADVAKTFEYRDSSDALRLLDHDEVGTQNVRVNLSDGRSQVRALSVIYEDGIWELIFRSSKPEAKAIKKRVKQILREIREHGAYVSPDITPQQSIRLLEKIDYKGVLNALASAKGYKNLPRKAFANMQNSFYKVVIGTTAADFKRRKGLPTSAVVKDYLNDEELSRLQGLSMVLVGKLQVAYPDGVYDVNDFVDIFFKVIQEEFEHRPVLH